MFNPATREQIAEKYRMAKERISSFHIRHIANVDGNVCLISTAYPGVWLEHALDGLHYALSFPEDPHSREVAVNHMRLFINNRRADGRLPYNVLDEELKQRKNWINAKSIGYRQIQECVSFGAICMDVHRLSGDRVFLEDAYEALKGWDEWLCAHRMTMGKGLIEMFCLFDTGHDNSARFEGIPNATPDDDGCIPADNPALPILCPDMNAVFYGDRMAAADMAQELGLEAEAAVWRKKAEEVRNAMLELLYDPKEDFFFDVDCKGNRRPIKSSSITNIFTEHLLTQAEFDSIWARHMINPQEFGTPYPIPSIAYNSGYADNHAKDNCWGYYSQALTALRCSRWMDFYGHGAEYDEMLTKWVNVMAQQDENIFTQELDPISGEPTSCSKWYSSAMLLYLYAVDRLKLI